MRSPAPAARRPSPLRRREKSPARPAGESAFPYEYPASRARPSVESAYPYEYPASRARPAWRTETEEDDGIEDDDDLYGLEPSYTERSSRQAPLVRLSVEPEGIELDDDPDDGLDLDTFSAYAYAMTRRSGTRRDEASIPSFGDLGPAGRNACSRLAESKGKGKYEGMARLAPLGSIAESMAMAASVSRPRSRQVAFGHRSDRGDSPPPPMPAPMGEIIEADNPWSDTYEAFYLTPLPPLNTTTYSPSDLPTPKRRTNHYINRPTIIPPHTVAILIAESANTSPTTTTGGTSTNPATTNTTAATTTTTTSTTSTTASTTTTSTSPTTTTAQPQTPPPLTPGPLTPDDVDEGFSEPTTLETPTEQLERETLACIARGCGRAAWRRARGGVGDAGGDAVGGGVAGGGEGGVVRPRVRKRISRRKVGRRDG